MARSERADLVGCPEFRRNLAMDRRGFVKAGALGLGGLSLAHLMRLEAGVKDRKKVSRDKSVIILWKRGGPSQHETWDPKPDAPKEYRGAFGTMPTKVPGTHICDLLPKCAAMTDKFAIIRSLHHKNAGHSAGDQILFTGYPPGKNPNENTYPSCGSIVAKQLGHLNPELPPYVMIPRHLPGVEPAYLGKKYGPFYTGAAPADSSTWPKNKGKFQVPNFELAEGLDFNRLDTRRNLLGSFDKVASCFGERNPEIGQYFFDLTESFDVSQALRDIVGEQVANQIVKNSTVFPQRLNEGVITAKIGSLIGVKARENGFQALERVANGVVEKDISSCVPPKK